MQRQALVVVLLLAALFSLLPVLTVSQQEIMLWQAATALSHQDYAQAESLAAPLLVADPENYSAALIAGDAASGLHEHERAIQYYESIPASAGDHYLLAQLGLGERWLKLGDIKKSEDSFADVLSQWPDHFLANKRYSYLMQIQGRNWESVLPVMRMIRQGLFGATELHIIGSPPNHFLLDERMLELVESVDPEGVKHLMAKAKNAVLLHETDDARSYYEEIFAKEPGSIEAFIQLGRMYLDAGDQQAFLSLEQRRPHGAEEHASTWKNRGIYATQSNDYPAAARAYWEALSRSPHRVETSYLLSQVLVELGEQELADIVGERGRKLAFIELTIPEFYDDPTPERTKTLYDEFSKLQRHWEAAAICEFALRYYRTPLDWVPEALKQSAIHLRESDAELFPLGELDQLAKLENFPVPDLTLEGTPQEQKLSLAELPEIKFEDRASDVGIDFTYFNGSLSTRGMEHIFETTGGGIVTLDYDLDYWPDLYLTQGAAIWEGDDRVRTIDRLYRNRKSNFADTTLQASLGDADFGQGATCGDFNNDGFPDIYVCNLRGNRFYENNGDGTFTEITEQTKTAGDEWSLSSVIADLNGDQLPDLYVVNYLDREAVFEQRCKKNGEPLTCAPTMFPAAQDRVYLNQGNGLFSEVTDEAGIIVPEGKGLAILAADFDRTGRISLFIGNDTSPNFLFSNQTVDPQQLRFTEAGLLSGLALDGSGRSQATMGLAYGNISGSLESELFLTNFFGFANTYYEHESPGQFVDRTRLARLYDPSVQTLGFGTEFLDVDLNGELDLFVTNGHVDRSFATGHPDEMSPQMFYNSGAGSFELIAGAAIGDYFARKFLGRTVSRLDWNRDGKADLCVLHLYSPVALLTNETSRTGNFVKLHLKGTNSSRDAVGTSVRIKVADREDEFQLVAGDGYMTSNERHILIGLGEYQEIDEMQITWPDQTVQVYLDITAGREYLAIETDDQLLELIKQ